MHRTKNADERLPTGPHSASPAPRSDPRNAYMIVDRVGMQVELTPHLFGQNRRPTGQRGLYGYARVGGGVTNENAVRRLVTS